MNRYYNNYLMHYGVKGMKWGVRHDKPRNGKSFRKGLSDKQKKTLKRVAIGATIAGAGLLSVYAGTKLKDYRSYDVILKAGKTTISRMDTSDNLHELFYGSVYEKDAIGYKKSKAFADAKEMKIGLKKDVKVAGTKTAKKIFDEWKKGTTYENFSYEDFNGEIVRLNSAMKEHGLKLKDTYAGPYFELLKTKGYQALKDTQDKSMKMPIIFINDESIYKILK